MNNEDKMADKPMTMRSWTPLRVGVFCGWLAIWSSLAGISLSLAEIKKAVIVASEAISSMTRKNSSIGKPPVEGCGLGNPQSKTEPASHPTTGGGK